MSRIGSRDELEAFLVTRRDSLMRFGYVLTGSTSAAEDLTQNALIEVFKRWRTVNPAGAEAYTRRAMTRMAWRLAKKQPVTGILELIESQPARMADHDAELDIRAAVRRLSMDKRTIIVLRYWLGHTDAQIADELGCSVGTVKSRGHRAVAELRALLGAPLVASRANTADEPRQSPDSRPSTQEQPR